MSRPTLSIAVVCCCALPVLGTAAEPERSSARAPLVTPSRPMVEHKHALVTRLLGDTAVIGRINASDNTDARDYLARAITLHAHGRGAIQSGDFGAADAAFNDAIWLIGKARQLVPDASRRVIEQRARYDRLASTLEALREAYRQHLSRAGRAESGDAAWTDVSRLIERARSQRAAERLSEANVALLRGEQRLLEAIGGMLSGATLDYTPRFTDPTEEFRYELERNRGYRELVPIAISEFRPTGEAAKRVGINLEADRLLSGKARELAQAKSYAEALSTIRASTLLLQRALRDAGLVVPEDDASQSGGGGS